MADDGDMVSDRSRRDWALGSRVPRVAVLLLGAVVGCAITSPNIPDDDADRATGGSVSAGGSGAGGASAAKGGNTGTQASGGSGGSRSSGGTTGGAGGRNAGSGGAAAGGSAACSPSATPNQPVTADVQMPAGANYAVASFRLWYPKAVASVKAVLMLDPGSNSDGRGDVTNTDWQQFANTEKVALVGSYFRDRDTSLVDELYAQAALGSGQALLDALAKLAAQTGRCELAVAPLLLWGMSAGGEFNYDFTSFAPERVVAFVVNKGGYYHPPLPSATTATVPGLLFIGGQDAQYRIDAINTLYAAGRAFAAPWALTIERKLAHDLGDSPALARLFFHAILPLRLPSDGSRALRSIDQTRGYVGDLDALTVTAAGPSPPAKLARTAWLPDQATADAWKTIVNK
jgi:hypothetical protein